MLAVIDYILFFLPIFQVKMNVEVNEVFLIQSEMHMFSKY